ncbi:MAG TPA: RNA polymerase sigma factor [Streptosporangiaceae bacterium]|nr:RNA polymerase sigma factor [Streptosporangiaceae bacterium]
MIGKDFETVLAAAQRGDEEAFARLWRDGQPALLRYLRVIVPEAADDLAAETWLQVVRGLAAFTGGEQNWRAWLFTTARRRVIDRTRQAVRRPSVSLDALPDLALAEHNGTHSPDAADIALDNIRTREAIALIATLPPMQAEVIMLRVVAGLDTETVGQMLGRSPGAIRIAAHRGLHRLAGLIAEAGVTP